MTHTYNTETRAELARYHLASARAMNEYWTMTDPITHAAGLAPIAGIVEAAERVINRAPDPWQVVTAQLRNILADMLTIE